MVADEGTAVSPARTRPEGPGEDGNAGYFGSRRWSHVSGRESVKFLQRRKFVRRLTIAVILMAKEKRATEDG